MGLEEGVDEEGEGGGEEGEEGGQALSGQRGWSDQRGRGGEGVGEGWVQQEGRVRSGFVMILSSPLWAGVRRRWDCNSNLHRSKRSP